MFKDMRRKEKQMSEDRMIEILKTGEYGVLSLLNEQGYPYGVPVNYVYNHDKLYIHCAKTGSKVEGIRKEEKVSFGVVPTHGVISKQFTSYFESVIVFGRAKLIEGEATIAPLKAFIEKYSPEYIESGFKYAEGSFGKTIIIEISPEHITGKSSNLDKMNESF